MASEIPLGIPLHWANFDLGCPHCMILDKQQAARIITLMMHHTIPFIAIGRALTLSIVSPNRHQPQLHHLSLLV